MSERGVFAVDRGIWDHPMFADEPFTEREAWSWLIGEASFKARTRNVGGKVVKLERGQLAASVRFIAERWKWSKSRVDRFLKRLKIETMIGTDSGTGLLVITICNYDKYQRVSLPCRDTERDTSRDTDGTAAGQQRDKREDTEDTKKNAAASPTALNPEVELFRRGREVLGKQAGGMISQLLNAKQKNVALARAAIEQASTKSDPREYIGAVIRGPKSSPNEPNWLDGIPGVI